MSNFTSGFGLRAVYHPSGVIRTRSLEFPAASISGVLAQNQVGTITGGTLTVSATGAPGTGGNVVFAGFQYTDANGARQKASWVNASAITSGTIVVDVYEGDTEFEAVYIGTSNQAGLQGKSVVLSSNAATAPAVPTLSYITPTSAVTATAGGVVLITDLADSVGNVPINSNTPGGGKQSWTDVNPVLRVRLATPYSGGAVGSSRA